MTDDLLASIRAEHLFGQRSLFVRLTPFVASLAAAFALYPIDGNDTYGGWFLAGLAAAAVTIAAIGAPSHLRPRHADLLPLLTFLSSIAFLREAHGGARSGYAPLMLIPIVWAAVFGGRGVLAVVIAAVAVTVALPPLVVGAPRYPPGEVRRAVLIVLVGVVIGLVIQMLVRRLIRAEAALLRHRADDVHDDLVQAFAVAQLALASGRSDMAEAAITGGLAAAQRIAAEMQGEADLEDPAPGSLRRERPSAL